MWELHDRMGEELSVASCNNLIRSIEKNGQRHPVLGRLLSRFDEHEVELIYGARRLFVARHLGVPLLVDVRDITDQVALVEMDIENRVRADISPYERGISYRKWLRSGFFDSQTELARSLGISEAQVSRLLRFADLPAAVVGAFGSPSTIREEWAVALAKQCRDSTARQMLATRARSIAQSSRRLPPQKIYDSLINHGPKAPVHAKPRDSIIKDVNGHSFMRVSMKSKSVHFIVQRDVVTNTVLDSITKRIAETLSIEI
jgi:ParB family chromosome partitioning protein